MTKTNVATIYRTGFESGREENGDQFRRRLRDWKTVLAVSCAVAVAAGVGGLTTVIFAFVGREAEHSRTSMIGTVMISASLAALVLAAHCIDEVHAADRAIRFLSFQTLDSSDLKQ